MRNCATALLLALGLGMSAMPASAQDPLPPGSDAPDFALDGATRYGVLAEPVRLSELRDQAVVIAFFYRARTRG